MMILFIHIPAFDTHPHNNMEIISYIVDGETLKKGEVQYLSAGNGKDLRLLQIWIIPPEQNLAKL